MRAFVRTTFVSPLFHVENPYTRSYYYHHDYYDYPVGRRLIGGGGERGTLVRFYLPFQPKSFASPSLPAVEYILRLMKIPETHAHVYNPGTCHPLVSEPGISRRIEQTGRMMAL